MATAAVPASSPTAKSTKSPLGKQPSVPATATTSAAAAKARAAAAAALGATPPATSAAATPPPSAGKLPSTSGPVPGASNADEADEARKAAAAKDRKRTTSEPSGPPRPFHIWAEDWISMVLGVRLREPAAGESPSTPRMSPMMSPDSGRGSSSGAGKMVYLAGIVEELESQEYTMRQLVERVLMARLTHEHEPFARTPNCFQYLLGCFRQAEETVKTLRSTSPLHPFLAETKDLVVSYCRIVLEDASMFEDSLEPAHHLNDLADAVPRSTRSPDGLPNGFLYALLEFCATADEGASFETIFEPVLMRLRSNILKCTEVYAAQPIVLALQGLCKNSPAFATMVLEHKRFISDNAGGMRSGRVFEVETLLGPFFRATVIPDMHLDPTHAATRPQPYQGIEMYLDSVTDAEFNAGQAESVHSTVRQSTNMMTTALYETVRALLKVKKYRGKILDFLSMYLRYNQTRVRTHGSQVLVATDGFALCISTVFLKLCEAFANPGKPAFAKIDSTYIFREEARVANVSEAALVPDVASAGLDEWKAAHDFGAAPPNFVTEIFFMTLNALHIGTVPTAHRYSNDWVGRHGRLAQAHRAMRDAPPQEQDRIRGMLKKLIGTKLCFDAQLLNPDVLALTLNFYTFAALWLCNAADPSGAGLPLPEVVPVEVAALPEYFVGDFTELMVFAAKHAPRVLSQSMYSTALVKCMVTFLDSPLYFTNPYQRAKIVEVLSLFAPSNGGPPSKLFDTALSDPFSVQHLPNAVMQFYVDAEETDFYMKLEMRYNTQKILKEVWKAPRSREGFIRASSGEKFVRFVMMMINDATFLLDDARSGLKTIHDCKAEMAVAGWAASAAEEAQDELKKKLRDAEGQTRSSLQLVDETLNLFVYVTTDIIEPFLRPELVNRLAAMLNLNIEALIGPKASEILIDDPVEYGFDSKLLLIQMIDIYLHLSGIRGGEAAVNDVFVQAVVADERSYKHELLVQAATQVDYERGASFKKLADVVHQVWKDNVNEEEDLGEIPDDYLDPIMYTLMTDPVKLPSNISVDRSTIASHLLSDPSDPFNRAPLTLEMLVPDTELKATIDAWVASKKKK